jgi:hypothetical protein
VALGEGVIIFDNYFAVCETDLSCLVSLPTEDGGLYHIVADALLATTTAATTTAATTPVFEVTTSRKLCLSFVLTALDSVETID